MATVIEQAMVFGNEEISRRAGLSLRWFHTLRARGMGPPVAEIKVGKLMCLGISEEELAAWATARKVAPARFAKVA
jgi:hypothetical protein